MRARRRGGVAMILVLCLLGTLAAFSAAAVARQRLLHRQILDAELEEQALALARSGLARGRWALARDAAFRGEGPVALGEGAFRVAVTGTGEDAVLTAVGEVARRGRRRTVSLACPAP